MKLTSRRALVTGASRGLGRSIAEALAQRGVDLALVARNADALDELAKIVGGQSYPTDLADPGAVDGLIDRVEDDGPIDLLVNNAAIWQVRRFGDFCAEEVRQMLQVNLSPPMELCRQLAPRLMHRRRGHIVNVSSLGAAALGPAGSPIAPRRLG